MIHIHLRCMYSSSGIFLLSKNVCSYLPERIQIKYADPWLIEKLLGSEGLPWLMRIMKLGNSFTFWDVICLFVLTTHWAQVFLHKPHGGTFHDLWQLSCALSSVLSASDMPLVFAHSSFIFLSRLHAFGYPHLTIGMPAKITLYVWF